MKIEAAIFDIGNVLLFFDYMKAANRLAAKNRLGRLPDRARVTEIIHAHEIGQLPKAEFLKAVRAEFADEGDESEFVAIWVDIFEENARMTGLARRLAEKMPVFLMSNTGEIHHRHIAEKYPVFSVFLDGVFSYRAGLLKPDPAIFALAIERFGVNPAATLYFDDMQENCAAAASAGFLAYRYEPGREDLPEAWGIPV